nr:TAXI family TRAP transporter solute-binding subunit [uncultured Ruminococcus sp.]
MKKILALLLVMMTVLLCSCSSGGETIRFGAAGTGGIYNETANSIKSIADADGSLKIETKTTAGSAANVRLLSQNYLDAAIVQSDIAYDALNGENNFEKSGTLEGYSAVAGLFTEACHIVVREDSDIKSVDDLLGKTVSIGEEESGSELNAKQILSAYGLNAKMVKEKNLNYAEAATQLKNGDIDAAFFTLGLNATVVEELSKQCKIRLIGIDDATAKKLKNTYSYVDCTIPKDTYNGQSDEVGTVAVKAVLIVNDRLSTGDVKKLTKLVFDNAQELQLTVSADVDITTEKAVDGVKIPFHKGAAEYYAEKGITVKTAG